MLGTLAVVAHLMQGQPVIERDSYGVPIIRANAEPQAWRLAGYAVAQDRLWQMEKSRRLSRGKMAEVFGKDFVQSDREIILNGYTDAELTSQVASLSSEVREAFSDYAAGVNDWIEEATEKGQLPTEYAQNGFKPSPWTPEDSAAVGIRLFQIFGRMTAGEIRNLAALQYLQSQKALGGKALDVFDDLIWQNDSESPTTVAKEDESQCPPAYFLPSAERANTLKSLAALPKTNLFELLPGVQLAERKVSTALAMRAGVLYKTGSYATVVSPKRSATGYPLLLSAPQMGFSNPSIVHEMAIKTPDFTVQGMDVPGVPGIAIGATRTLAWGLTTGVADMEDIYFAKNLDGDSVEVDGSPQKLDVSMSTIQVKGGSPLVVKRIRYQDAPFVLKTSSGYSFFRRASSFGKELLGLESLFGMYRSRSVDDIQKSLSIASVNFNCFYALRNGDIGYHYTGQIPIRARGWDPRLPMPLSSATRWTGMLPFDSLPHVRNPKSGLIYNWNNKPVSWWPNGDTPVWGAFFRSTILGSYLTSNKLAVSDLELAAWNIARMSDRVTPFLPYLKQSPVPDLADYDGRLLDGSVQAPKFDAWYRAVRDEIFLKTTGNFLSADLFDQAIQPSVVLRALQGRTKFDFLKGRSAESIARSADATARKVTKRLSANSIHLGATTIPYSNRGTYIQFIELDADVRGRNVLPPGVAEEGDHSSDQVNLSRAWLYKPMTLLDSEAVRK